MFAETVLFTPPASASYDRTIRVCGVSSRRSGDERDGQCLVVIDIGERLPIANALACAVLAGNLSASSSGGGGDGNNGAGSGGGGPRKHVTVRLVVASRGGDLTVWDVPASSERGFNLLSGRNRITGALLLGVVEAVERRSLQLYT